MCWCVNFVSTQCIFLCWCVYFVSTQCIFLCWCVNFVSTQCIFLSDHLIPLLWSVPCNSQCQPNIHQQGRLPARLSCYPNMDCRFTLGERRKKERKTHSWVHTLDVQQFFIVSKDASKPWKMLTGIETPSNLLTIEDKKKGGGGLGCVHGQIYQNTRRLLQHRTFYFYLYQIYLCFEASHYVYF